jgi:hypothetical protein
LRSTEHETVDSNSSEDEDEDSLDSNSSEDEDEDSLDFQSSRLTRNELYLLRERMHLPTKR